MSDLSWNASSGAMEFRLREIEGRIVADGRRQGVSDLVHRPTGTSVGHPDILPHPILAPYRLLCRSGWMGELREYMHHASPIDGGMRVVWQARLAHQAVVVMDVRPNEPNAIDLEIEVISLAVYEDYEVFLSNYFAPGFAPGAYVWGAGGQVEQVRPESNPVFRGMYVAFPRDERSANLMTDGRWQRGRHWTRFVPGRYYGHPIGFCAHEESPVDVLVMGLPGDVFGVSMAYAGDSDTDGLARHRSLYMHLFGQTICPGEARRTRVRLVVGEYGRDVERHLEVYRAFIREASHVVARPPVDVDRLTEFD